MFPSVDNAIARYEGFGIPGVPATRNNNPGNLEYGDFSISHGAIGSDGRFAVFPDVQSGFAAMDSLVQGYALSGHTLNETLADWNGNGANTPQYQAFVSQQTGLPGNEVLPLFNPFNWPKLAGAVGGAVDDQLGTGSLPEMVDKASEKIFGISWLRFAFFVLGIISVAIGLMSFKPVNDVVITVRDKAVDAVKSAAVAGATAGAA